MEEDCKIVSGVISESDLVVDPYNKIITENEKLKFGQAGAFL